MNCPVITSGNDFVQTSLGYVDCQARTLGSVGFQVLAAPGSSLSLALTGFLTLYVALLGVRLLLGDELPYRNLVTGILKIGFFLMLATSWSAFRVTIFDVVNDGAAEIASPVAASAGLGPVDRTLSYRLQAVDDAVVQLTRVTTGRYQAGVVAVDQGGSADDAFRGTALRDDVGFGGARLAFLLGIIAPLALVRLSAGLLLALAPLFAPMILFETTRNAFVKWLTGLLACLIGAIAVTLLICIELAALEPFLSDALLRRSQGIALPQTPTELLALTIAFGSVEYGTLLAFSRIIITGNSAVGVTLASLTEKFQSLSGHSSRESAETILGGYRGSHSHFAPERIISSSGWGSAGRDERVLAVNATGPDPPGRPTSTNGSVDRHVDRLGQVFSRTRYRVTGRARQRMARDG